MEIPIGCLQTQAYVFCRIASEPLDFPIGAARQLD
jgi:hypothetical protein